jgi:hypothetical protein
MPRNQFVLGPFELVMRENRGLSPIILVVCPLLFLSVPYCSSLLLLLLVAHF